MPNISESWHQAELLLGDGPPKPGTEKTGRGAHRRDSQPIASGLSRRGWNNNEQGEEGRGGAPSPYIGVRDFTRAHLRSRGEVSPSRASSHQPPPDAREAAKSPACAERSRALGKQTLAAFPESQAERTFLASRSRAPSRARCANKAACSPGAQLGYWAGVANTP
jgi:hypothetical protein